MSLKKLNYNFIGEAAFTDIWDIMSTQYKIPMNDTLSESVRNLITKCLHKKPELRIKLEVHIQHIQTSLFK